jgi:hypothetical protein
MSRSQSILEASHLPTKHKIKPEYWECNDGCVVVSFIHAVLQAVTACDRPY